MILWKPASLRQVFTAIPDRNSFGEVCLCNTCLQQVLNLTITSTKLKSTHLSTKQLDEAIQAIDQQLDKGYFSQDIEYYGVARPLHTVK